MNTSVENMETFPVVDRLYPFSHNNSFLWGFGDGVFNFPKSGDSFWFQYSATSRQLSLSAAVEDACVKIANANSREIVLGFSGGYDSQAVAIGLMRAKIPFKCLTMKMTHNGVVINQDDINSSTEFTRRHNLPHIFVEKSIVDLFKMVRSVISKYGLFEVPGLIQSSLADECPEALLLIGIGTIDQACIGDTIMHHYVNHYTSSYNLHLGRHAIDNFYMYTPELIMAFRYHPLIQLYERSMPAMLSVYKRDLIDRTKVTLAPQHIYSKYIKPLLFEQEFGSYIHHVEKKHGYELVKESLDRLTEWSVRLGNDENIKYSGIMTREDWDSLYYQNTKVVRKRAYC